MWQALTGSLGSMPMMIWGIAWGLEVGARECSSVRQWDALRQMGCDQVQGSFYQPAIALWKKLCYFPGCLPHWAAKTKR